MRLCAQGGGITARLNTAAMPRTNRGPERPDDHPLGSRKHDIWTARRHKRLEAPAYDPIPLRAGRQLDDASNYTRASECRTQGPGRWQAQGNLDPDREHPWPDDVRAHRNHASVVTATLSAFRSVAQRIITVAGQKLARDRCRQPRDENALNWPHSDDVRKEALVCVVVAPSLCGHDAIFSVSAMRRQL